MQSKLGRVFSRKNPSTSSSHPSTSNPLVGRHMPDYKSFYTVKKKLGKGGLSIIKDKYGLTFLCKTLNKKQKPEEDIRREVEIMYHLDGHPCIARLFEVVNDGTSVYIIMNICEGGDLSMMMVKKSSLLSWPKKKPKPLTEDQARKVFRQIAEAIHYCHGMNVMYRDIKPENFMFLSKKEDIILFNKEDDMAMELIDFGLSTFFKPGEQFEDQVGSLPYIAPEVATNSQPYGPKADVWSAGVILYYLLTGELPFSTETMNDLPRAIRESGYKNFATNRAWQNMPGGARHLVSSMLKEKVEERYCAAQIIGHPWLGHEYSDPLLAQKKDILIVGRMKKFQAMSNFKRIAIKLIVQSLPQEQTSGLRNMYELIRNPHYVSNPGKRYKGKDVAEGLTFHQMKFGLAKWGVDDPEIDQLLKSMDVDGDEVIDQAEFIAATIHCERYGQRDVLEKAFKVYDKANKGYMTAETLLPVLKQCNLPEHKQNQVVQEVFDEGQRYLSFERFFRKMLG